MFYIICDYGRIVYMETARALIKPFYYTRIVLYTAHHHGAQPPRRPADILHMFTRRSRARGRGEGCTYTTCAQQPL